MHDTSLNFKRREIILNDKTVRSLCGLLPDAMARQIDLLWASDRADLLSMSERQLIKEMVRADKSPDPRDYALRFRFWYEFERVQEEMDVHPKMNMALILGRHIPKEVFYRHYITDPMRLGFMLHPPVDYAAAIEQALARAMFKLIDYLDKTELTDENILKSTKLLDNIHQRHIAMTFRMGRGQKGKAAVEEPGAESETAEETVEQRVARLKNARELTKVEE